MIPIGELEPIKYPITLFPKLSVELIRHLGDTAIPSIVFKNDTIILF